jgi:hypothetical protein
MFTHFYPSLCYLTLYGQLLNLSTSLVGILLKGVEILLVLHPVSAGLSLITFTQALFLGHHGVSIFALIMALLTALVSSVTLAADIALVVVAKSKVKDLTIAKFDVDFGNGVWMVSPVFCPDAELLMECVCVCDRS